MNRWKGKRKRKQTLTLKDEFPVSIDRNKPYDLCQYFAGNSQPLGYFTYIVYKERKIAWIETQTRDNGVEPTQEQKENHVMNLTVAEYNSYVRTAQETLLKSMENMVADVFKPEVENDMETTLSAKSRNDIENLSKNTLSPLDNIFVGILTSSFAALLLSWVTCLTNNQNKDTLKSITIGWLIIAIIEFVYLRFKK